MERTIVCLNDYEKTTFETDYSVEAIEECFENSGYCVVSSLNDGARYMLTPSSIFYIKSLISKNNDKEQIVDKKDKKDKKEKKEK